MSTRVHARRTSEAALVAVVIAAAIASPLAGQSGSGESGAGASPPDRLELEPSPAALGSIVLRSLRITGSALKPRENDVNYAVDANGSCFYVTAGSASTVWNFPITLPDGATVDTLRIYYYDASASNLSAWFTVYDLYGSIVEEWSVSSSGTPGNSFDDSVQIGHVIDHNVYSYVVNVRPVGTGSSLQFCGVRLFYTP